MKNTINNEFVLNKISKNNDIKTNRNSKADKSINPNAFAEILGGLKSSKLEFSKHAEKRISQRNIKLSTEDIKKIDGAIDEANSKGIKEALILLNDNALIASIKNKTIVTATKKSEMQSKIVSNIDGAIIL